MPDTNEALDPMEDELEVIPIEDIEGAEPQEPEEPKAEAEETPEPSAEPGNKIPESVPYGRFQEVYHDGKQAKEMATALYQQNQQLMRMLQGAQQAQIQRSPRQPVDPEVEAFIKLLKPALDQEQAPLLERLGQQEAVIQQLSSKMDADARWLWLNQQVPDLNNLAADLSAYIDSRPDAREIYENPNRMYDAAQIVRLMRESKGNKVSGEVSAQVRKESRTRGRVELPNTQPGTSPKDWSKVSDADFDRISRESGF